MPKKKKMDPYSIDFIFQYDSCSPVYYITDESKHTESLYCDFRNGTIIERFYFSDKAPITSNWMELFNYGEHDWYDPDNNNRLLNTFNDLIRGFTKIDKAKSVEFFKNEACLNLFADDTFSSSSDQCLNQLSSLLTDCPSLCICYPFFFDTIKSITAFLNGEKSKKQTIVEFSKSLTRLYYCSETIKVYYEVIRNYVRDVFIIPFEKGITLAPDVISELHKNYCNLYHAETPDFYYNSTSECFPNVGTYEEVPDDPGWDGYLASRQSSEAEGIPVYSLNQFAHIGITQLIRDGRSIRKCKLCGKYFKARYSASQEYCTRIYKDTKFACNEYISRRSAKDRFFEHPIHAEYNKAYNRLYARMRRGKVPKDTQLTAKLKSLHDDYYDRYEHTHQKDREAVWKEYIVKNKELLS